MDFLNFASWSGAPLMAALLFGITCPKFRALTIATLLITIPLSLLLAANNNQANAVRNFFMGMVMFSVPLLLHAWLGVLLNRRQTPGPTGCAPSGAFLNLSVCAAEQYPHKLVFGCDSHSYILCVNFCVRSYTWPRISLSIPNCSTVQWK